MSRARQKEHAKQVTMEQFMKRLKKLIDTDKQTNNRWRRVINIKMKNGWWL